MIKKIIEFCALNRWLVILFTLLVGAVSVYLLKNIRLDALPDLSDTQVIIFSRWDRSPDIIEDQVTYPIVTALLGAPEVKAIRGFSDFGFSYVYVIFKDGTDLYWARSRVLEYLSKIQPRLPEGVQTELGPDATGVGWVFQYALKDESNTYSLDELRSMPIRMLHTGLFNRVDLPDVSRHPYITPHRSVTPPVQQFLVHYRKLLMAKTGG